VSNDYELMMTKMLSEAMIITSAVTQIKNKPTFLKILEVI
jgi:hypothetical protein